MWKLMFAFEYWSRFEFTLNVGCSSIIMIKMSTRMDKVVKVKLKKMFRISKIK